MDIELTQSMLKIAALASIAVGVALMYAAFMKVGEIVEARRRREREHRRWVAAQKRESGFSGKNQNLEA